MELRIVDEIREILHSRLSLDSLLQQYHRLEEQARDETCAKLLAEIYYLISLEHLRLGNYKESITAANESIVLYEHLNIQTYDQAAPILFKYVPDLMHEDVVRKNIFGQIPPSFLR